MFNKIRTFLKGMVDVVSKSDVDNDFQNSIKYIDVVLDGYRIASNITNLNNFTREDVKRIVNSFYMGVDAVSQDKRVLSINQNFTKDIITLFENARTNSKVISDYINKNHRENIATSGMSIKSANTLRAVPHYYFMAHYAMELINFIVAKETESINKSPTSIPKKIVDDLNKNARIFGRLLGTYGDNPKEFKRRLAFLSDSFVTKEEDKRIEAYKAEGIVDLIPGLEVGFVGSPIYHIRLSFARWQAERHKKEIVTRDLLELRLAYYMTLRESGEADASVEEEIEHLQNRVNKLSYSIQKMEDSLND